MSEVRPWDRAGGHSEAADWQRAAGTPLRRGEGAGLSTGLVLAGIAAVAVGFWAWNHFGADFRRYIKMERM